MMARILLLVFFCITLQSYSQQSAIYLDPEYNYQIAVDLFAKQKYGAAQKEFQKLLDSPDHVSHTTLGNASYYIAKCAAELFNRDAEFLLMNFIEQYPSNSNYQNALYELGNYHYRLKHYKNAIDWFTQIDQSDLDELKKDEINFKQGFSYYKTNDYEKAGKAFYAMKDGNSKYATAAQYYYSHIAYVNENYETALQGFIKLKESEAFAPVAPYYITQILYKQGKYDEVLNYAPGVIDSVATKNGLEISRMVAESYYRKEKYKEALPFLLDYEKNSAAAGRSDYYTIAFSYYKLGEYENASGYFQRVVTSDDSLGQNGYYHLADCFLHMGNKRSARNAFQSAAKLEFDKAIQEESQFNFAKLSYELAFQSVAIDAFRTFLNDFPKSANYTRANEMLIDIYASTHNYKDALVALNAIPDKTPNLKAAYQKVAYYRGVEFFMDNNLAEAVKMFAIAIENPIDQKLVAQSHYWSGEANYKLGNFEEAIRSYSLFYVTPSALRLSNYNTANYNIGYAFFKQEDFSNSQMAFRKYVEDKQQTDPAHYSDAMLRLGDCFFMMNDKASAMDYYNRAISLNAKAGDYALFQKAILLGVQGNMSEKVSTLQKLMEKYPKSVYFDDALYEAGQASVAMHEFDKGNAYFRKIISDYPKSTYFRKAELGEALVFYNTGQDERAMTAFKKIVGKYPNTEESAEAVTIIRKLYISQNNANEFITWSRSIPNYDMSSAEEDSIMYESAENRYTQGDCPGAIKDFTTYLEKYSNAQFKVNANYMRADCYYRSGKNQDALAGFEFVINQPISRFSEKSLYHAATIYFLQNQYEKSLSLFEKLEEITKSKDINIYALGNQLRCNYKLNNCEKALLVSQKIFDTQPADENLIIEAHLVAGRCYFQRDDFTNAKKELTIVSKRKGGEMTAEAKYLLASIEFNLANYKASQNLIYEIQKLTPAYDFWIAKGFILLGDNYLAQKDTFQAKATYKSIVENFVYKPEYPEDLRDTARQKLADLVQAQENRDANERRKKESAIPADSTEVEPGK